MSLPGTPTRGTVHLLRTLDATATPPRMLARDHRFHGQDGNGLGIVIALILAAPFWAIAIGWAWLAWPTIRGGLRVAGDVLRVVGL